MWLSSEKVDVVIQGKGVHLITHAKSMMAAAMGSDRLLNQSYFTMLDLPISESLVYLDLFLSLLEQQENKKNVPIPSNITFDADPIPSPAA